MGTCGMVTSPVVGPVRSPFDEFSQGIVVATVPMDPAKPQVFVPLVPCAKLGAIPGLTFLIAGVEHHLSAQQMAIQDMDTMHEVLHGYQPPFPIGEGICMLAITQLNTLTSGIDVVL